MRPLLRHHPLRGPATKPTPPLERSAGLLPRSSRTTHRTITAKMLGRRRRRRRSTARPPTAPSSTCTRRRLPHVRDRHPPPDRPAPASCICNARCSRSTTASPYAGLEDNSANVSRPTDAPSTTGTPPTASCRPATPRAVTWPSPPPSACVTPAPCCGCIAGLSPRLDFDHRTKRRHHNAAATLHPVRRLRRVAKTVVGSRVRPHHLPGQRRPYGLPPVLIQCAEGEVLRVDAEPTALRLEALAVPCDVQAAGRGPRLPGALRPDARQLRRPRGFITFVEETVATSSYAVGRRSGGQSADLRSVEIA